MYALESSTITYYSHKPSEIILRILHTLLPSPSKNLKTLQIKLQNIPKRKYL